MTQRRMALLIEVCVRARLLVRYNASHSSSIALVLVAPVAKKRSDIDDMMNGGSTF